MSISEKLTLSGILGLQTVVSLGKDTLWKGGSNTEACFSNKSVKEGEFVFSTKKLVQ